MQKNFLFIFFCCLLYQVASGSNLSRGADTTGYPETAPETDNRYIYKLSDSSVLYLVYIRGSCKQLTCMSQVYKTRILTPETDSNPKLLSPMMPDLKTTTSHKSIHGDMLYDYSRHSSPDTSFPGSSFIQHHALINLYATLWNKYPVVFHAGTLQTNIPYIKNYVDASVQFDRKEYGSSMLHRYQERILQQESQDERKDSLLYATTVNRFENRQALSNWLSSDKQLQQLISSNNLLRQYAPKDSSVTNALASVDQIKNQVHSPNLERVLSSPGTLTSSPDTTTADSSSASAEKIHKAKQFIKEYSDKWKALQKTEKEQDSLERRYDSARNRLKIRKDSLDKLINNEDLAQLEKRYPDSSKEMRTYRRMMDIRQLSLGRTNVDYSQLSAKNISVTGINAEYCNHYYFALAAGKIDFRYLDFLTASAVPNQYLLLGRAGIGEKESRHLYFTYYTGSKQASYLTLNNSPAVNKLSGITLEARLPIDRNTYITGEIGKSTYPAYIATGTRPGKLLGFSDRNNEAYSIQLYSYLPATDTRIYGVYNKMGIYFQSFNIFNNNANTSSWQARVDQYLWKKRLALSASVKKNDFTTPFIVNNYKSRTWFYSLQASLRLPKWPVFTLGYLPYSQLTGINGQLIENRFYTLIGSSSYAYRVKSIYMSSSAVYTRYFNSSNQTGFLFYNAQSWFFNHSVLLKQFSLNGSATITSSPGYYLFTAGPGVQWKISRKLSVGGGMKYNNLNNVNKMPGYNGNMDFQIGRPGRVNLSYERGYIPGQNNRLFRNDWGRVTYNKNF